VPADVQPRNSKAGPRPIRAGQTVEAALDGGDPSDEYSRYETYTFAGKRGERVDIRMSSKEFDSALELFRYEGDNRKKVLWNDNAGSATQDARIVTILDDDAQYGILAQSRDNSATARVFQLHLAVTPPAYTVTKDLQPKSSVSGHRPIRFGQTVEAAIDEGERESEWRGESYTFEGKRGERVDISLSSKDFDAHLELGHVVSDNWVTFARNDNAGSASKDSRITTVLPAAGPYVIVVRNAEGYHKNEIYVLRLSRP
jgi:hypothetical protein